MPVRNLPERAPGRASTPVVAFVCLAFAIAAVLAADIWRVELRVLFASEAGPIAWLRDGLLRPFEWSIVLTFLTPLFGATMVVIWLLESWRPARPEQPLISRGLVCDAVWVPVREIGRVLFVFAAIHWVNVSFDRHLGFLVIDAANTLAYPVRLIAAFVLFDLVYYVVHVIHHRVPLLWELHAVHHSQRELNSLTVYRVHFLSSLTTTLLYAIPIGVFSLDIATAGPAALFILCHNRLAHANLRTNLGPLRFLFVTPQSHRIHHALAARYRDHNFGQTFSIWDQLFRTQYESSHDYPETGIEDATFPLEQDCDGLRVLAAPLRQALHPLRRIARGDFITAGRLRTGLARAGASSAGVARGAAQR